MCGSRFWEDAMRYPWVHEYLLAMPDVTADFQQDWRWQRYRVGDKLFACVCMDERNQPYYITVKLPPDEGELLRSQYEDVLPGYYMNKQHWNSVRADGSVPEDVLKAMLDHAWQTAFSQLTKKKQREIMDRLEGREQE